ncbi:sugar transferase [Pseudomonadota bacterium]
MKRLFDLFAVISGLLVLWPLLLLLALLVRIKLGSPVLFRQQRPGLHGVPFFIYKFRTMTDDRDMNGELLPDADRLPPFGSLLRRFSLDELPQLYNVLKGDISLVGPRALLMEYLPLYNNQQARRHDVKPGITGWAQVNGRNAISWEEKFEYDLWYVDHHSFLLDLKILWMTLLKVGRSEGVAKSGHVTMEKFLGSPK